MFICGYDYNLFPPTFGTDDAHTQIRGAVLFSILAWTSQTPTKRIFFSVAGAAAVAGTRNRWEAFIEDFADGFSFVVWEANELRSHPSGGSSTSSATGREPAWS